ncbi:MAG: eukaryotic-like serine/threonine-protein kinase [Blastocatellia bacterium]|jgi:serine/threonine protein kinase|nr:eukaryotic-like serine/threonine-protein kinase [Blastocatellia bacterium]
MSELKLQQCRLDGRYDILECLGRGSYAEIYVSRDTMAADGSPQLVVIKALNLQLQGVLDEELERTLIENFQNEAIALDRVRHPHIINRLGHGTAIDLSGTTFHYIVLEYMSGGNLLELCRKQPLTLERTLFYLEQVCAGLAYAHECGVIHRDIKPQNLLLTADHKTVKIADFGVAKLDATEGAITRVGTNVYAAPEHNPLVQTGPLDLDSLSDSQRHLMPAADIYSLAKTTYTLLAGEAPRRFSQRQITELPEAIAAQPWAAHVLRVLRHATETQQGKRYQTVQEFWDDLADAALPPTQLLSPPGESESIPRATGRLTAQTGTTVPAAPPPRFDSKRVMEQSLGRGNGRVRPKIVVPVAQAQVVQTAAPVERRRPAQDIIAEMSDAPKLREDARARRREAREAAAMSAGESRLVRWVVAFVIILVFAGLLLATHTYIRSRWTNNPPRPNNAAQQSNAPVSDVGREGVARTDVNLRPDPSMSNAPVGMAENGSRVKVLSVNNSWYEVQVLQHGREKDDPSSSDRGWINRRFIKFD